MSLGLQDGGAKPRYDRVTEIYSPRSVLVERTATWRGSLAVPSGIRRRVRSVLNRPQTRVVNWKPLATTSIERNKAFEFAC